MSVQSLSPESFQTFGDLLKFLRRRERLTQLELSISVGYSEAQIGRLEQNQRKPDLTAVKALFIPALHLEEEPDLSFRLLELARSARQEDAPAPGFPPYKGLLFFDVADADLFFGREALTAHLVERVTDLALDASSRFLAVVGASGSGKSSLVRAGLAVALQRLGWEIHTFTPGASPLEMLAASYDPPAANDGKDHLVMVDQFEETFTLCRDEKERPEFIERLISIARDKPLNTTVVIALRADFYSHCAQYPLLRAVVAAEQEYIGQMTQAELRRAIEEPARRGGWEFEPGLVDILLGDIGADGLGQPEPGALPLLSHALLATWERRRGRTFTIHGYHASGGVRGAIAETAESVFTDQLNQAQQELAHDIFLRLTELGEGTEDTRRRATLNELAHQSEEAVQLRTVLDMLAEARLITLNEDTAEVAHEALIREWQRLHEWLSQDREGLLLHRHLTDAALEWEGRERDPAELYRGARLAQTSEWAAVNEARLNALERGFLTGSIEQEQHEALEREAQRQRELMAAQKLAETERQRAEEQGRAAKRLRQRALYLSLAVVIAVGMALAAVAFGQQASKNANLAGQNLSAAQSASTQAVAQRSTAESASLLSQAQKVTAEAASTLAVGEASLRATSQADSAHQAAIAKSRALSAEAIASLQVDSGQSISLTLQSLQIQPAVETYSLLHRALFSSHLRATIHAHDSDAIYIAISPAGDRLATTGALGRVKVWQVNGGVIDPAPLLVLEDLDAGCKGSTSTSLMFSPNGSRLAVGACDSYISLVDARPGELIRTLTPDWGGLPGELASLGFSPDGRWLAAFGEFGQITLWDVENGQNLLTFVANKPGQGPIAITCFDFSPDSRRLATGGEDGELKLWSLEGGTDGLKATLTARLVQKNEGPVQALRFSPDGNKLAEATLDAIHILDLAPLVSGPAGADLVKIPLNKNTVRLNSLYFTPAGDHLISTEIATLKYAADLTPYDNEIQIWDAATGFLLLNIMPEQQLMAGVISSDGQTFFTAHVGGEIHSWDISSLGSSEGLAASAGGSGGAIYLSPDGKRLLVMNQVDLDVGKYQFTWQKVDGNQAVPLGRFTISLGERQAMVLVDKNLSRIVAVDLKNLCRVFNAADGVQLKEFQSHVGGDFVLKADASRLLMHADNIFPTDSLIEVWDIPAGSRLFRFHIPDTAFYSAFSPDGKRIVTYNGNISSAQLIRWWDPATGKKIKEIDLGQAINGVVFTPDGKFWLSWGDDQTVKIYDAGTDKQVRKLSPTAQITSVIVSPDNHTIAVGLSTAQTTLYSFEDGHELVTLPGSPIDFFPDRPAILNTISGDPTVYAFDFNNTDLVRLACERLKNITLSNSGATSPLKICQDKGE